MPGNLSFVVFTNSSGDYRVTVRSANEKLPESERLVEGIACACDPWIDGGFEALVGLIRSPDRGGRSLAFRVFDAGVFMSRPHTLGLVAVEIPEPARRGWTAAQLLQTLAPPVPNATTYEIPSEQSICAASVTAEPFRSLHVWEQQHVADLRADLPETPVWFSNPRHIAPKFAEVCASASSVRAVAVSSGRDTEEKGAGVASGSPPRKYLLIMLLGFVLLVAILWVFEPWRFINTRSHPPVSDLPSQQILLRVLSESSVHLLPTADAEQVRSILVDTAGEAEERRQALKKALSGLPDRPAHISESTIKIHRDLWNRSLTISNQRPKDSDAKAVQDAIKVHRSYQAAWRVMKQLEGLDREGNDFARNLDQLRNLLNTDAGSEPATGR